MVGLCFTTDLARVVLLVRGVASGVTALAGFVRLYRETCAVAGGGS
jgi:hypothetical protein